MKGVLEILSETYIVNESKKTVTYIITIATKDNFNGNKNVHINEWALAKYLKMTSYKTKISGVAKCSPNDEFDEKKGVQIARNRAEIKVAQLEQKAIGWIFKHLTIVADHLAKLSSNRQHMINEKKNFIKNI